MAQKELCSAPPSNLDRWSDEDLDMDFEAAMLGVEPGQPGPGMAESDRLVRALAQPEDDE